MLRSVPFVMLTNRNQPCIYSKALKKLSSFPGIFRCDDIRTGKNPESAQRNVAHIADWYAHDVEARGWQFLLRQACRLHQHIIGPKII